jgi:hypothetical protein
MQTTTKNHHQNLGSWRNDRVFWLILGIAFLLGLIYNFVIMPGYGPDEHRHFNYVKLLIEEHRLPFQLPDGSEYHGAHTYHPPLYYIFLIPFYLIGRFLPGDAIWHVMRLGSLFLCLAALVLAYDIALRALNGSRQAARLATATLALLPIFGMTTGIINNDSATLLACILFLWLLLRHPLVRGQSDSGWRSTVILGIVFGLGALCKASVLPADTAALLTALWLGRKRNTLPVMTQLRYACIVFFIAGVIAAPWYLRNHAMYGSFQPIPQGYTNPALPDPSMGMLTMMMHDNFPPLFIIANRGIFITQWSQKDWIPETLRTPIYSIFLFYCCIAAIGIMLAAARRWRARHGNAGHTDTTELQKESASRTEGIIALVPYAVMWILCLQIALFVHWGQAEGGRYLLPTLAGFVIWLAAGWHKLIGEKRLTIVLATWGTGLLSLNILAIYWLLSYLNPTFGPHL